MILRARAPDGVFLFKNVSEGNIIIGIIFNLL